MNIVEATKELTERPLVFGDEKQIAANKFLSDCEAAKEMVAKCSMGHMHAEPCWTCDGHGTHKCPDCEHEHDCRTCRATGVLGELAINVLDCRCLQKFKNNDVKEEIVVWLRGQWEVKRKAAA